MNKSCKIINCGINYNIYVHASCARLFSLSICWVYDLKQVFIPRQQCNALHVNSQWRIQACRFGGQLLPFIPPFSSFPLPLPFSSLSFIPFSPSSLLPPTWNPTRGFGDGVAANAFLSRVSTLTRDIDIANLYVCLFVRPSRSGIRWKRLNRLSLVFFSIYLNQENP